MKRILQIKHQWSRLFSIIIYKLWRVTICRGTAAWMFFIIQILFSIIYYIHKLIREPTGINDKYCSLKILFCRDIT